MAMMCSARLIRRLPARESRWRTWSPLEASRGAVPFQDANLPLSANRAMSPTSPRIRAAPEGPMPCTCSRLLPVAGYQLPEFGIGGLDALAGEGELGEQLGGEPSTGLARYVP